jgi:hypothetical protein
MACKRGQGDNRNMPEMNKSAFIVIKDGVERTVNNWVTHLKDHTNQYGRVYTRGLINQYAQKKKYGFSYKDYPDLLGGGLEEDRGVGDYSRVLEDIEYESHKVHHEVC